MNFLDMMSGDVPATFDERFDAVKELMDRIGAPNVPMPRERPAEAPMQPIVATGGNRPMFEPMEFSDVRRLPTKLADVPLPVARPAEADVPQTEISSQSRGRVPMNDGLLSLIVPDADSRRRFKAALAGGMAGGNPAFSGGAFMRGMSGGLTGSAKSDETDFDQRVKLLDRAMKQRDAEGTGRYKDALARYYESLAERDPTQRKAWNKPLEQRTLESEKLIISKNRAIDKELGLDNPLLTGEKRAAAEAEAARRKQAFEQDIRTRMGVGKTETGKDEISMQGHGTRDKPFQPSTSADYDEIPSGAYYIHPSDGKLRLKK